LRLCKPKVTCGLGLREIEVLIQALTAKMWWRWLKGPRYVWKKNMEKLIYTRDQSISLI